MLWGNRPGRSGGPIVGVATGRGRQATGPPRHRCPERTGGGGLHGPPDRGLDQLAERPRGWVLGSSGCVVPGGQGAGPEQQIDPSDHFVGHDCLGAGLRHRVSGATCRGLAPPLPKGTGLCMHGTPHGDHVRASHRRPAVSRSGRVPGRIRRAVWERVGRACVDPTRLRNRTRHLMTFA